jgi:hypothetical protein
MFLDAAPHILTQRPAMSTVKKNMRSPFHPPRKKQEPVEIAFDAGGFGMPKF